MYHIDNTGLLFMKKYENFCKSLENLHEGLKLDEPYSVVEQTGIVKLFEICFEQAWKLMKAVLEENGRFEQRTGSPHGIIKTAYQCGMLDNDEGWLELLEAHNLLAHTYSDEQSIAVIRQMKASYIFLFDELKTEIETHWIVDKEE